MDEIVCMRKVAVIQDPHHPFHHKKAWALMLKALKAWKPDIIAHTGDALDAYCVSSHDKHYDRSEGLEWEVDETNKCLDQVEGLGATDHYFCSGNHEYRVDRYCMKHPELTGMLKVNKLLRFKERGWRYTEYNEHYKIGKVHFTHDVQSSSRQHKIKALGIYQHSIITGHDHRSIQIVEGNALGDVKISAGFGWLGDAKQAADYMKQHVARSQWALGFGIGYLDPKTGYIYFVSVPIINDSCMIEGRVYTI